MIDLVLWGAGGHGKVVLDVARAIGGFQPISFVDDARAEGSEFCGCQVIGASPRRLRAEVASQCLVSIGNNRTRAACLQRALELGLLPATLVHPSAVLSPTARIGGGTVVMPRVVINASAQIGTNCIVNTAAVVEHDCQIGDHVHLSPGVLLGGGVRVHAFAHIGIGAIVLPGAEIGEGSIVGAGAVVIDSVPAGITVVGIPARLLRRNT